MNPIAIPLATAGVPALAINLALLISIHDGYVEPCFVYLQGCTSISKAGRMGSAAIVFKGAMLPMAAVLAAYWWLSLEWLRQLGGGEFRRSRAMLWVGVLASLFLVIYTVALGTEGALYRLMRRYGVYVFFSGTLAAQLLQFLCLRELAPVNCRGPLRLVATLLTILLLQGLISVPVYALISDNDWLENLLEWQSSAIMGSYYLVTAVMWHRTGFRLHGTLGGGPPRHTDSNR